MAKYRKLSRTSNQRKALLRNQVTQLLYHGKIRTTEAKAKEIAMVYDAIKSADPDEKLVQIKSLEALEEIAKGDANKEYDKYKSGNRDKLCLLSSLLFTKDNNEKIEIINSLFSDKIKNIFSHYFL